MEESETKLNKRKTGYGPVAAVLVTVGVYFFAQLLIGLVLSAIPLFTGWDTKQLQDWLSDSEFAQFITILLVEAVTLWLIWQFLLTRRVSLKKIGLVKPVSRDVGYALVGYIVYFVLFISISLIARALIPGLDLEQEQEIGFSKQATGVALLYIFASLVVLPAVTEEIVVRGFLYTGLRSKLPFITSAIITSFIFAAAHLQWGNGQALLWVAALDTFVLSLILVYLRERTGSLWSPILVHALKNGFAFLLLFIFKVS